MECKRDRGSKVTDGGLVSEVWDLGNVQRKGGQRGYEKRGNRRLEQKWGTLGITAQRVKKALKDAARQRSGNDKAGESEDAKKKNANKGGNG